LVGGALSVSLAFIHATTVLYSCVLLLYY